MLRSLLNRPVAFVRARFSKRRTKPVRWIVLHSMESPEDSSMAERLGRYFATLTGRTASAHYGVDNDSVVQYVPDDEVAYHAAGLNEQSIGIEQAGRAAQDAAGWSDHFSQQMIDTQVIPLVAHLVTKHHIPVRFVDAAAINRGEAGITTHAEVSKAKRKSTHWDPGPNYPIHYVVMKVQHFIDWFSAVGSQESRSAPVPAPPKADVAAALRAIAEIVESIKRRPVRRGERSVRVRLIQKLLNRQGFPVTVDDIFGPQTERAVRAFQNSRRLKADGVVGRKTIEALMR